MTVTFDTAADRAVKAIHPALWASDEYRAIVTELIPTPGATLGETAGVRARPAVPRPARAPAPLWARPARMRAVR